MTYSIAQISNRTLVALNLAELIDYHLEHNPYDTFTVFPGESVGDEPSRISFLEFGRASHRFARAIYPDAPVKEREVVGIVVNADSLMWITALAGIVRAGATALIISPRNSSTAICHMLRTASSHRLIVTNSSLGSLVNDVQEEMSLLGHAIELQELPRLPDIYPHLAQESKSDAFQPVSPSAHVKSPNDIVLYLHSSGSTGLPKLIPTTNEVLSKMVYSSLVEPLKNVKRPYFLAAPGLPGFHVGGIWMHLVYPLYSGRPSGILRPTFPLPPPVSSPAVILAALKSLKPTATLIMPSILESWAHDAEAVKYLKTIDEIRFGGSPLSTAIGDALVAQGCRLRSVYGCTEAAFITAQEAIDVTPNEWAWCEFGPNVDIRWRPAENGAFELQVLRSEKCITSVENLPDTRGYATQDLWVPHPTKPNAWKLVGRVDDLIVLANGEKVVPAPIEGAILAHPVVRGVVAFGRERSQVGLLIEPTEEYTIDPNNNHTLVVFLNRIWGAVEEANRDSPAFARIYKEMILVSSSDKPLPRTGKGNVQKKAALKLYEKEIDTLYESIQLPEKSSGVQPPLAWDEENLSVWLNSIARSVLGKGVKVDSDLFAQGFDSLSATFLRNNIFSTLRHAIEPSVVRAAQAIDSGFIYAHPTISSMTAAIVSLVNPDESPIVNDSAAAIKAMIERYSADLPSIVSTGAPKPEQHVVLLTGSTRGLGSQLLATLLQDEHVGRVYALNRPLRGKTSLARHEDTFRERNIDENVLLCTKLVLLEGDTSRERLGLPVQTYDEILKSVTIIIHNAWRLDFNLALASFESAVCGTRNLLDLAMTSTHAAHVRVLFTSSSGVAQSWPHDRGLFPEEPQADARWCVGSGYSESKYVCEQLLDSAANRGLQTTSFRIGQICGSHDTGTWAVSDWVALLMRSSVSLGCLPNAVGAVSWITPEAVAGVILDVAFGQGWPERALNVVHPHPIAWTAMVETAADELACQKITRSRLPLVAMSEWFAKLSEAAVGADEEKLKRIPAIKILEFFRAQTTSDMAVRASGSTHGEAGGAAAFSLAKVQRASSTMRELQPLHTTDVGRWISYWKMKGVFDYMH